MAHRAESSLMSKYNNNEKEMPDIMVEGRSAEGTF